MPITIKVNGRANSLVHKMSSGISNATIPDVCKTPTPGGPVPTPYPNIAQSITLSNGTTNVKGDRMMAANKGSKFALSNGDNAGTLGGVKSNVFMKEATWILYSFDVKLNGKNASRLSDKMFHNAENAANLGGELQKFVADDEEDAEIKNILCNLFCEVRAKGHRQKDDSNFDYSGEARKLAGKKPYKDLFAAHGLLTERSMLVKMGQGFLAATGRSPYSPAAIVGRMARKVAQGVVGYASKFAPVVNIAALLLDPKAGPIGTQANISSVAGQVGSGEVVRVKPDVCTLGKHGRPDTIYDYKFDYKNGQKDSYRNGQDKAFTKATGKEPTTIDADNCNGCAPME